MLAADSMEGREAGSAGHRKAAEYVAGRFAAAGLTAAGEGGFYQPVPLHAVRVVPETPADMVPPPRFVPGPRGYAQTPPRGYYGTITIESSAGPEPMRWPSFLSTIAQLADAPLPSRAPGSTSNFQANAADAEALFEGSGHTYAELRAMADAGQRLPSFPMSTRLRGRLVTDTREFSSDNVIAMLRGSDAALANEYVVVSAHLDGYGIGEAINGDRIYNGAFDDAAYVATLIDLAETLQSSRRRFKR
ncbi:MAG TPA: M28 family peptidase [Vicinamibacterales bacterium]|nr:M28 family peptidase [Vicinamibacterales bacterium]